MGPSWWPDPARSPPSSQYPGRYLIYLSILYLSARYLSYIWFIYLPIYLSKYLYTYIHIYLSTYLPIYINPSLFLTLKIFLLLKRQFFSFLWKTTRNISTNLSTYISVYLPVYLPIYLSIYLSTYLSRCRRNLCLTERVLTTFFIWLSPSPPHPTSPSSRWTSWPTCSNAPGSSTSPRANCPREHAHKNKIMFFCPRKIRSYSILKILIFFLFVIFIADLYSPMKGVRDQRIWIM